MDKCNESCEREMQQPTSKTMRVCMQLTHSMLRTGVFQRCGPLLKKLFDDIVSLTIWYPKYRLKVSLIITGSLFLENFQYYMILERSFFLYQYTKEGSPANAVTKL
ncbi:unnamed protein product [Haemonchus placei]|uniref:Uncharacterized protein n=1 Tax=Haemonchus placei TaxID=6290 RepID=A0A3P7U8J0_HAEPC|nr:unnamed protein product [Haemonchus placei]